MSIFVWDKINLSYGIHNWGKKWSITINRYVTDMSKEHACENYMLIDNGAQPHVTRISG